MMRILLRCLLAALLGLACGPAIAQSHVPHGTVVLHVSEGRLLRLEHDASNILVGDSAIADVQVISPRTVYVYGRKPGLTNLTGTDGESGLAASIPLQVVRSGAEVEGSLPHGSEVTVGFEGNRMVVRGDVPNLDQALDANAATRAFNMGAVPPLDQTRLAGAQQVTLRVRIAEVSRSELNQLGLNLDAAGTAGSFAFGLMTGSYAGAVAANAVSGLSGGLTGLSGGNSFGNANVGVTSRHVNANALLNALQSEGVLSTLAEPNLTAISGETATFRAGGEVPIPVPQSLGVTTIQYKSYGVELSFKPVVLPNDRIALHVHPQVSELSGATNVSYNGTAVPAFISRDAETSVEMASGQTLAIAGLFQRGVQTTIQKFPFLADVPILGALFRSTSYQKGETELVILVTPYLSQPVSQQDAFPLPSDAAGASAPRPVTVDAGFVVD